MDMEELAVINTYKDMNKIAYYIIMYLTGQIDKERLMKNVKEPTLDAPPARREELPELGELMKELYDLIDNEAWAHVADHMQEIQNYIVEKIGENDVFG
ncbi:MAG: hypothetical protein DRJ63_10320 [Thermoprotei archaeon]|nr:MAG: hypothetical protein DRJ63_10320 [Thermoprotei archaeon]